MRNQVKSTFALKFLKPKKPLSPEVQTIVVEKIERVDVKPKITEITIPEKPLPLTVQKIEEQEENEEPYSDFVIIESEYLSSFTTEEWKAILAGKKIPQYDQLYISLQTGVSKHL